MLLKTELYSKNSRLTLAENIDKAWKIYIDKSGRQDDWEVSQGFLIYAFNIKYTDNINQQLLQLIEERNKYKEKNPEYIPNLSPRHLTLPPEEMSPDRTGETRVSTSPVIDGLLKAGEMLDVNAEDKKHDLNNTPQTPYLFAHDRIKYRVHIYEGKFYRNMKFFSTGNYVTHGKKQYGAFTINANGELSVFSHVGIRGYNFHSSMNAGSPVVCAGEIAIENGKLMAITAYSGHYKSNLFNIYRALEYFYEKGVDLSLTKVLANNNPVDNNLKVHSVKVDIPSTTSFRGFTRYYEIPASEFFNVLRDKLADSLHTIQTYIQQYASTSLENVCLAIKDAILRSTLTQARMEIAMEVRDIASQLMEEKSSDFDDNSTHLHSLVTQLVHLKDRNIQLSITNGKDSDSGRLHQWIETFLQQAIALQNIKKPDIKEVDLNNMKYFY